MRVGKSTLLSLASLILSAPHMTPWVAIAFAGLLLVLGAVYRALGD
ncbi:MAG: hypothetical protein RLZZ22_1204 [Pseudomonadota bacterium]|jgi:hypothetical protein